ncbi:uncharacterized protein LOC143785028 isoform X2 [Ranitomeya variabilis]|uniref:uncharacterized protein LOC143785028 isoform X2 n=1 Tax=Ranitomeya variabilis TaxID=490064 RepID=UPI00405749D1
MTALTLVLIKHSGPTPADDMAPQTITDCGDFTLDLQQLGLWPLHSSSRLWDLGPLTTVRFFFSLAQSSGTVVIMSYFSCLVSVFCFPFACLGVILRYSICGSFFSPRVVGVFSRSATVDYEWLMTALKSPMFTGLVAEPRPVYISNRDEGHFREAVQDCDFVILYHTKNRGRINIINVTDSLYDEELTYMSSSKGRDNVIVLVDDLEKSDYQEKCRILDGQPDITIYSRDLILVTSNEKRHPQLLGQKLQDIKANISAGSWTTVNLCNYLESMAAWVYNNISAVCSFTAVPYRRRGPGELDEPLLA